MKIHFLRLILIVALPSQVFASLKVDPSEFYTHEDKTVRFEFVATDDQKNLPLSLVQVDPEGKVVRFIGSLLDNGFLGDRKSGDGVFSRKIQFKEMKSRTMKFIVIREDKLTQRPHRGDPLPPEAILQADSETVTAAIKVEHRPSFVELVGRLWRKATHHN